jgi:RNA polymerase sigma-70 factor (ECF subfamily)
LKAWHYIHGGNAIKNVNALVYQIARNLVIDHYRKRGTQDQPLSAELERTIVDEAPQHQELHQSLDRAYLEQLMTHLKDEYREVLLLRYIEEYSIKEVAQIMNKSAASIKVLAHRALKRVQSLSKAQKK